MNPPAMPERPHVLIVGGFSTSPPLYWSMARRLRARGAASVSIAPIWLPDWMLASRLGLGPLGRRTARAIVSAWRAGARRPLIVIGHSAGGILARLAMSPVPFDGRATGVGEAVGALVTLGSPHHVVTATSPGASAPTAGARRRLAWQSGAGAAAATFLDREQPGAALAPRTGYVTVASSLIPGTPDGERRVPARHRFAGRVYEGLLGESGRRARGDGLIPVESAHLAGAAQITLGDAVHGQLGGGPWYGSDEMIDRWWPAALDVWRAALRARASGADR